MPELDERGRGLDCGVAFSDGVFAIATTLLVLNRWSAPLGPPTRPTLTARFGGDAARA